MLKTYTLLFKKWEKHGKIPHGNCFNVSFKYHCLTNVKETLLANSHTDRSQIFHLNKASALMIFETWREIFSSRGNIPNFSMVQAGFFFFKVT